jgi:hypothetical protein
MSSPFANSEILQVVTGATRKPDEEHPGGPADFWGSAADDLRPAWSRREATVLVVRIPVRVCWPFVLLGAVFAGLGLAAVLTQ